MSASRNASAPRLYWLLGVFLFVFAVLPPLGAWLWTLAPGTTLRWAALPMALQFELSRLIFGSALFVRTEEAGPLPTIGGWVVTILIWAAIAVLLWMLIKSLLRRRKT